MRNLIICTFIVSAVLMSGCQQSYQGSTPYPHESEPRILSQKNADPRSVAPGSREGAPLGYGNRDKISARPYLTGPTGDTVFIESDSEAISDEDGSSEEVSMVDQALELCTLAQQMWEEGKLDEALQHLDNAYYLILELDTGECSELAQQKEDIRFMISKRIIEIYSSRQMVVTGTHNEIPLTMNEHVHFEIQQLTGPEKNFFSRSLERSLRYRPYIEEQLQAAGLPKELSWLPLIESGYNARALSPARALGMWQFIPSTGHRFGLMRNQYIDERMDPEKSTRAAIAYLKDLHDLFGDWTTVLAAYNCGEGRVLRTIDSQKINYLDNFWDLYQKLPRETARYVPRFLATLHIVQNPEAYGITIDNSVTPVPFTTVEIHKQIRLQDIASEIGVTVETLKILNPELRQDMLPPEAYSLKIPEEKAEIFLARKDQIKSVTPAAPARSYAYHKVRKGDTLSGIAHGYQTSVTEITRINKLDKNNTIIAGRVLKVPRGGSHEKQEAPAQTRNTAASSQSRETISRASLIQKESPKPLTYKVRRGDNLWIIARKFSTTTRQIISLNKLPGSSLHVGQTLNIPSGSAQTHQAKEKKPSVYLVKSGDSPAIIAKRHNMSLNRLLSLNQLSSKTKIFPGQQLIIE